jgi:hypothetical protein
MKFKSLFAIFILFHSLPLQAQTPVSFTSSIAYDNIYANGDYSIFSNAGTTLNVVDKPIIMVEGFDPMNEYPAAALASKFNSDQSNALTTQLLNLGYDIITLNFANGGDYIQRNAFLLIELINRVNAQKTGNEQLVVIGVSMGGLVARYALTYMEHNTINHNTRLFVSMDTPHEGAYIPLSLQFLMNKTANYLPPVGIMFDHVINCEAARQMLLVHIGATMNNSSHPYTPQQSSLRTSLMNELATMGNFPMNCKKISISNGSKSGLFQKNHIGNRLSLNQEFIFFTDLAAYNSIGYSMFPPIFDEQNNEMAGNCLWYNLMFMESGNIGIKGYNNFETLPGGNFPWVSSVMELFSNAGIPTETYLVPSFISTESALSLNIPAQNWGENLSEDKELMCKTPFDAIYAPLDENQLHTSIPTVTSNWLFEHINNPDNTIDINNGVRFNFGFNTSDYIDMNMNINNGGELHINSGTNTDWMPKNLSVNTSNAQPYPMVSSSFNVQTNPCRNSTEIIVNSGGVLKIGEGNRYGTITLRTGSRLILGNNSTLLVNNNSKIILENGSRLIIEKDVAINLVGTNSVIEIQDGGLIEIGNNATFTWTGKGYIKVNNDPNQPGKVNVRAASGATNAKFFKQGAWVSQDGGYTEKLIEINSGSLSFDRSIEEVNIKFGLIKLHSETFVDVEPTCYFDNVTFDWAGSGQKHNGLWVYGQQNTPYVSGCKFKNATRGITVFPLVQGVGVKNGIAQSTHATITNSSFNLCDMAIYVDARGADITNCSFTNASGGNDHSGIVLRGLQYNSRLETITSQLNNIGIDLLGTFHNETSVKRSVIFNNATAGIMGRGTKLALGCNAIYNNSSTSNRGYNIWMHPGTRLIAENAISPGSNYNNLSSYNSSAVYLDNVFGLHIQDGYTDFESVNEGILGTIIPYEVTSNPSQYDAIKINYARNNYWDRFGASPQMFTHHAVAYDDGWTVYFTDFDDLGTSLSTKPDIIGNCYLGETGEEPPSMFIGKSMIYDAENTPFDLKYMQARDYKLSNSYMDAYNEYKEIVTHAYDTLFNITGADNIMTSEFREWMDVILFSYSEMMECINEAYAQGQIDSTYDLQDILDVQTLLRNKMNIETITDTLQSHYAYDFLYKFDEAMLYRLFNDRETCKNKLYAMKSNIQTVSNSSLLNYYYCLVSKEQVMLSDTLNKAYLFTTFECDSFFPLVNYGPPIEVDNKKTSLRETNTELFKHTHIYPNPASDKISVKFDERLNGVHIQIIDLTGRILQQKKMEGILHKVDIPIDMQTGSYIIQIATDKGTVRKKFVVIK